MNVLPAATSTRAVSTAMTAADARVPLASGRTADVYAIHADGVLRRYRAGGDVAAEATLMAYLFEQGFPVPRVYAAEGPDVTMERLYGPTLAEALVAGTVDMVAGARVLADLHTRLHRLPPPASKGQAGEDPDGAILHLDLHPENVILTDGGPVLIDWSNAAVGAPDLDLALSALILAEVAVDPASPYAPAALILLTAFLTEVAEADGDPRSATAGTGDPIRLLDKAVTMRRADPARTQAEVGRLDQAATLARRSGPA